MELAGVVLGSLKSGLPLNICEAMRGCDSAWYVPSYCMYGVAVRLLVTTGVCMGVSLSLCRPTPLGCWRVILPTATLCTGTPVAMGAWCTVMLTATGVGGGDEVSLDAQLGHAGVGFGSC